LTGRKNFTRTRLGVGEKGECQKGVETSEMKKTGNGYFWQRERGKKKDKNYKEGGNLPHTPLSSKTSVGRLREKKKGEKGKGGATEKRNTETAIAGAKFKQGEERGMGQGFQKWRERGRTGPRALGKKVGELLLSLTTVGWKQI